MKHQAINCVEQMVRGLISSEEMSAEDFFIAVHNAFVHGDIVPSMGGKALKEIFDCFDKIKEICKEEGI